MAGSQAPKNAAKAASKADATKRRAAPASPAPSREAATDWVKRADELGVDAKAARQLDEEFVPQLKEAGYSNSEIKSLFLAEDPHLAAKQFIDDEKLKLMESIGAANYGFTPDQMLGMSLKDLRDTAASIQGKAKGKAGPPSRIRGQDPNAREAPESRLPGEETARADAPLGATPGEVPPVVPQPSNKKISEAKAAAIKTSETTKENVKKVGETGSMAGVDWLQSNRDSLVVGRDAGKGNWAGITAEDMTGERGPVFRSLPAEKEAPASPGVQPAPADEVAPKTPVTEAPAKPSITQTDPLMRAGAATAGAAQWVARNAWPTALGTAAAIGVAGHMLRGKQPAPGQQPQPGQGGQAPQINILPREALRQLEQRQAPPPPMQQPAPMAPAQPPMQAPPPGRNQTTDIIRQLAGRMV